MQVNVHMVIVPPVYIHFIYSISQSAQLVLEEFHMHPEVDVFKAKLSTRFVILNSPSVLNFK